MTGLRIRGLAAVAVLAALLSPSTVAGGTAAAPARQLAVVVNARNPATDLSFRQLKAHLKLDMRYWSNRKPCRLYLRPAGSVEMKILLKQVYKTDYGSLLRDFKQREHRGEIGFLPRTAKRTEEALGYVRKLEGGFTVVLADQIPADAKGIRVLKLDGKLPGEPGYPLVTTEALGAAASAP